MLLLELLHPSLPRRRATYSVLCTCVDQSVGCGGLETDEVDAGDLVPAPVDLQLRREVVRDVRRRGP